MITQEQQKQGTELINTLAQKAWESSNFKDQLMKNPVSTIESVTGKKMQPGISIIVEDQTDTSKIYLNIPRKIELDELELSDEQLEMVAGGTDVGFGILCGLAAGAFFRYALS
jgi:hypothetical protein